MLATLDKPMSNTGNIRGLNMVAVKLMTVHVTKMPLLQKARHFTPEGKPVVLIQYESWWAPEADEMFWRRNKFLILAGKQTLNRPASNLLNILKKRYPVTDPKGQRGGRGIALIFLDLGARAG
jgi:hypothetical protein